jgi:hypothetical protein
MTKRDMCHQIVFVPILLLCGLLVPAPASCRGGSLNGAFMITEAPDSVYGQPAAGMFNYLVGLPLSLTVSFESMTVSEDISKPGIEILTVQGHSVHVVFDGDSTPYLQDVVAASMEGSELNLRIENNRLANIATLQVILTSAGATSEYFSFQLMKSPIVVSVNEDNFIQLTDFELLGWPIVLERFDMVASKGTDAGLGSGEFHIEFNSTVATRHISFGQLKAHFQEARGHY